MRGVAPHYCWLWEEKGKKLGSGFAALLQPKERKRNKEGERESSAVPTAAKRTREKKKRRGAFFLPLLATGQKENQRERRGCIEFLQGKRKQRKKDEE